MQSDFIYGENGSPDDAKRKVILKYFGDVERLKRILTKAVSLTEGLTYDLTETNGDVKVELTFPTGKNRYSSDTLRFIVASLKDDIYAEYDVSLSQRLFDILKFKKLKISVAESFTGGRVVSSIINNSGASSVVREGVVCYSNESKTDRLGVSNDAILKDGAVSSVVAYQMATGLLKKGVDVAISTTGIAGPNSDDTNKPVGLCYIGIGMKDGVHTYKLNLKGDREAITERGKNTALFLAIKNIKNI